MLFFVEENLLFCYNLNMSKLKTAFLDLAKMLCIVLVATIVAVLLLAIVYSIPVDLLNKNARKSCDIMLEEGDYKRFFDNESYQLDNFTDATMISEAIYDSDDNVFVGSMLNQNGGMGVSGLANYLNGFGGSNSYSRYWHGYLIFLKPLLLVFSIKGIRILNLILQILLVVGICFVLRKKQKMLIVPYLISLLFINPLVISQSMQFSTIYYLMNLSFLCIILFYDKLKSKNWLKFAFLIFGLLTSFFDFLTYPLATLTVPLVAVLWFDEGDSLKEKLKTVILLCAFWAVGYFGFWFMKWLVGSIITNSNLFENALKQAQERIDGDIGYAPSKLSVVFAFTLNILPLLNYKNLVLCAVSIVLAILLFVKHRQDFKIKKAEIVGFICVALLPILWYFVLHNHSFMHYWFTFRSYIGTIFALSSILAYGFKNMKLKKERTNEKENSSDNSVLQ